MVIFPLTNKKAPAVPVGTNWQDYQGEAKTPLIGVMIPAGVIVLDIDTHKGCTTEQVDAALGVKLNWDLAELQDTMNGGRHYVFRVPEHLELPNGQDVLGVKGFDTRSSYKGYIATGKGYTNLTMLATVQEALHNLDFWGELPQEAINKLLGGRAGNTVADDDDFGVSDLEAAISHQPLDLTEDEVKLYVSKLPDSAADDGGLWLKVGMGIYHQSEGAEWGWELFDEFSQRCADKYDAKNNRKRWDSFGKNRDTVTHPVTFASIIELAGGREIVSTDKFEKLRGEVLEADNKDRLLEIIKEVGKLRLNDLDKTLIVKALQKRFSDVVGEKITEAQLNRLIKNSTRDTRARESFEFYKDYVYLTGTSEYMNKYTKATMKQRDFDVKHGRDTPLDADGNPQRASIFVNNMIECVHLGMYAPTFPDFFTYDGIDYFNTYKPNTLERVPQGTTDIVDRIKGQVAHLLPNEDEQQLFINYMAHNVQYQGKKLYWAIVLQGVQGDGKSFFAEMLKHVLGHTNCRSISAESLDEKFTGWAEGNCVTILEEIKIDNHKKYETLNKLKSYITNPTVSIRRMQRDVYEAINTTNYIALTNYKDALPIDDNDRRYCILFSRWQNKKELKEWMDNNPNYYEKLYQDMRNNAGEILDWLMTHPIPDSFKALNRAPETRAKEAMIEISKSADYLLVEDAIAEFECADINDFLVNITKLVRLATDGFSTGYALFPKDSRLRNILVDMGYHNIGRYKNRERKNQSIYCKDHTRKAVEFSNLVNSDDENAF